MPKILINEKDLTNPGLPGDYSNNKVLITGFCKTTFNERKAAKDNPEDVRIKPDDNGVYEFSSVSDFRDIIGKHEPELVRVQSNSKKKAANTTTQLTWLKHYGNQMAYELLNLGYTIYYKPIEKPDDVGWLRFKFDEAKKDGLIESETAFNEQDTSAFIEGSTGEVLDMTGDRFWEIFKDKSLYDFRFITHGFLSSTECTEETTELKKFNKLESLRNKLLKIQTKFLQQYPDYTPYEMFDQVGQLEKPNQTEESEGTEGIGPTGSATTTTDLKPALYLANAWDALKTQLLRDSFWADQPLLEDDNLNLNAYATFSSAYENFVGVPAQPKDKIAETVAKKYINAKTEAHKKYVTTSLINEINTQIANLAEYTYTEGPIIGLPGRGDCIALIELDESTYINKVEGLHTPEARIIEGINCMSGINSGNGKFCALTIPSVEYKMSEDVDFNFNKKFPAAFHYLTCYMNSLKKGYAEWFAAAGYTRGVSGYIINKTSVKLGEIAINALEPRYLTADGGPKFSCNVIANFRNSYYLWGNRTAYLLESYDGGGNLVASHFLNIRQLCTTIKKQLYVACRRFTFDPNSDTLWYNFVNAIKPTLERMKAEQGVRDYQILKVTEAGIPKATLKARIRIIPIEAVEDFDLEISLEDSFGETTAVVTE